LIVFGALAKRDLTYQIKKGRRRFTRAPEAESYSRELAGKEERGRLKKTL